MKKKLTAAIIASLIVVGCGRESRETEQSAAADPAPKQSIEEHFVQSAARLIAAGYQDNVGRPVAASLLISGLSWAHSPRSTDARWFFASNDDHEIEFRLTSATETPGGELLDVFPVEESTIGITAITFCQTQFAHFEQVTAAPMENGYSWVLAEEKVVDVPNQDWGFLLRVELTKWQEDPEIRCRVRFIYQPDQ